MRAAVSSCPSAARPLSSVQRGPSAPATNPSKNLRRLASTRIGVSRGSPAYASAAPTIAASRSAHSLDASS